MFLTLKNEKTLKKMRSKTLKNNIFFILGRNLIIRSFEIPHSIWKLHKDFKSVFVFKFRQKTKKFTPKWQKPLFEKRVKPDARETGSKLINHVFLLWARSSQQIKKVCSGPTRNYFSWPRDEKESTKDRPLLPHFLRRRQVNCFPASAFPVTLGRWTQGVHMNSCFVHEPNLDMLILLIA